MRQNTWNSITKPVGKDEALWEVFHENSKVSLHENFGRNDLAVFSRERLSEPFAFDPYPEVQLPGPVLQLDIALGAAIIRRAVVNELQPGSITLETLATLLHYSYGSVAEDAPSNAIRRRRAGPASGSFFPLELFFHNTQIENLEAGLYHYHPLRHSVRLLRRNDHSHKIASGLLDRRAAADAAVMLFITAVPERLTVAYGDRGYRYVMLEAGAIVDKFNLVSAGLGLTCVNIGEYIDRDFDRMLGLDGLTASTVYIMAIGNQPEKTAIQTQTD